MIILDSKCMESRVPDLIKELQCQLTVTTQKLNTVSVMPLNRPNLIKQVQCLTQMISMLDKYTLLLHPPLKPEKAKK